jgi:hypothetical protein
MAGRHGGPFGGQLAVLAGQRHRTKMQAVMGKIRGCSFRAGHKTDGPREREMSRIHGLERAESNRHRLRSNGRPSDEGGPKAAHAEGVNLVSRPTPRSRMHQEVINGNGK